MSLEAFSALSAWADDIKAHHTRLVLRLDRLRLALGVTPELSDEIERGFSILSSDPRYGVQQPIARPTDVSPPPAMTDRPHPMSSAPPAKRLSFHAPAIPLEDDEFHALPSDADFLRASGTVAVSSQREPICRSDLVLEEIRAEGWVR